MRQQIVARPAMILRHPSSPAPTLRQTADALALLRRDEIAAGPTPESIASAKAFQAAERSRLAALDVIFSDPDGARALAAALRGDLS